MVRKFRFNFAKLTSKATSQLAKYGSGEGKAIPGYIFLKVGGIESLRELANELKLGSILVTGTNGKTTTTTFLIKLLSNDLKIRKSFESNTINSITTSLLKQKGDLGVFEYGIRNVEFGIPDKVQNVLKPIGVVYTTISKEHTQVNGVKNPFLSYYHAKKLLTQDMEHGVIVTNCDDPRTALIGINKQDRVKINYYGIDTDKIKDIYDVGSVKCPKCNEHDLNYSKVFMNHRGFYECECGFKRPEPNVKLCDIEFGVDYWKLEIEGDLFNYPAKENVSFELELNVLPFGFHNIYNTLAAITAYSSFTPKIDNIENTIKNVFDNLDSSFIPPGRFEVVKFNQKVIGLGQGDNGDALKINGLFMSQFIKEPLEFIYTTPDEYEEEIFQDHLKTIECLNPEHIIVVPGRKSVKKAEEYYNLIKKEFDNVDFYPLSYKEMDVKIKKLTELATHSNYDYVMMSGCGEEQAMWEKIKRNIVNR